MLFIEALKQRNYPLFIFGVINLLLALLFLILSRVSDIQVAGTNAWYKPLKFALSIATYSFTMGWYVHYLGNTINIQLYNWAVIILLGFEIVYIGLQAGRGQLSHYNMSTPFYSGLYVAMALAASIVTLYTAYIGLLFFSQSFPALPNYYVWAIRLGILLFVIFSFEGFVMGSRLSHTIGAPDGGGGIPFLNWSRQYGDPRVAHFMGMHALQVLPLLSYYILKNTKLTFAVAVLYGIMAVYVLLQALNGKPFISR
ncbi:hypothetical protein E0W68_09190 [Flavobacterium salilacus subsp. salilacus]|uniref:hypothetical protein n=1 Tax=Flavobacterium TaxID=237 RepID=UPI0010750677|nr:MULTISPECIES: hypothetical protein [Flavobacterium]KAF2518489.1 hypothetical protein E0W68_09190 [Flavobacterium salilacus subsp. salilacus]MBE1615129.1 hypothetical protein [Flavobacterium sp. SaA2.13]